MTIYSHDLSSLYKSLLDTAEVWKEISERGCTKEKIPLLHHFRSSCPCCEFAFTAKKAVIETAGIKSLIENSYCNFCPLAGQWENPKSLSKNFGHAPCTIGIFGDWADFSPDSLEAQELALEISNRAYKVAQKIACILAHNFFINFYQRSAYYDPLSHL